MNSSSAQANARRQLSALVSAGTTVLGILALVWMATQIGAHRRPPTGTEALRWWLSWLLHTPSWTTWAVLLLLGLLVVRYGVLEALRWLIWIPRMARERVAYAVLPPEDFAPSAEAIAAFTADLLGMRRRVLAWLDREATAFVVGLTTDPDGRPLMYWEFPKRFEKELEAARSFYPGLQLVPLFGLLPSPMHSRRLLTRRLELHPGRPERFPLQSIAEQTDALQAFAGVLNSVDVEAGQRFEQRTYILPVPPSLMARVRRALVGAAREQEGRDPLATVNSLNDRFNPAEAIERRIERAGLWAKVGKAEPMFRVQVLVQASAPADGRVLGLERSEAAGGLVKAVFGAWEQWAGQNYMSSVGKPVLGGLAVLFGSNSILRRPWFDYRWRQGVMGRGKAWTSWELWPLLKPWTKFCRAPRILRRLGITLPPPENAPEDGMLICLSA
ncbi:MAG: hypothetical protein M3075_11250 [Candidatus Dormibacteraeota bacterium]|nr:hypothetical protein [Candidatus Dormibacteraeota bacterium]